LEIFNDILNAVQQESIDGEVYNTRIAQRCNMSYDKMTRYIEALKKKNLIQNFPLTITDKGKRFLQDYEKIKDFQVKMKIEYLTEEEEYIA
jgi:predicted transcriptional regulator